MPRTGRRHPTATLEWSPPNVQTKDPTTLYYDTFDTTGEVTAAGSYAFLKPDGDDSTTAVTTYEELRDGTTTSLLVNKSDAHGASQAGFYDSVEGGDVVEWREADQCWVRYRITATPASTLGATRAFGIAWVTYAATGCTGAANWEAAPTATLGVVPAERPDSGRDVAHSARALPPDSKRMGWRPRSTTTTVADRVSGSISRFGRPASSVAVVRHRRDPATSTLE